MPNAAAGQVYLITAMGSWAGQRIMLTHTYLLDSVNPGVDAGLAVETLIKYIRGGVGGLDQYETKYLGLLPPQYTLNKWRGQVIYPDRLVIREVARGVNGAHPEDTETGNQAVALTFRTELAGRNQVSNKHIGPIPQGPLTQDNGMLTAAYKGLVSDLGQAMESGIADLAINSVWVPVIWHGPPPGLSPTEITSWTVGDTLRTQRRRTVRLGE